VARSRPRLEPARREPKRWARLVLGRGDLPAPRPPECTLTATGRGLVSGLLVLSGHVDILDTIACVLRACYCRESLHVCARHDVRRVDNRQLYRATEEGSNSRDTYGVLARGGCGSAAGAGGERAPIALLVRRSPPLRLATRQLPEAGPCRNRDRESSSLTSRRA
jgi:hypothetical protein